MQVLIDVPDKLYENIMSGFVDNDDGHAVMIAVRNSQVVFKDNATNGNVIEKIFDVKDVDEMKCCTFVTIRPDYNTRFIKEWYNAPYQEKEVNQ